MYTMYFSGGVPWGGGGGRCEVRCGQSVCHSVCKCLCSRNRLGAGVCTTMYASVYVCIPEDFFKGGGGVSMYFSGGVPLYGEECATMYVSIIPQGWGVGGV